MARETGGRTEEGVVRDPTWHRNLLYRTCTVSRGKRLHTRAKLRSECRRQPPSITPIGISLADPFDSCGG